MAEIRLRQATHEDYDFLYELHRAALREYVEKTWGWNEAWQAAYFGEKFDVSGRRIIQQDGEDIGCLAVIDEGDCLFLSYIALAPEYQGRGIGSQLIEELLLQGRERQVPVRLRVLKANPAQALYERLGFTVTDTTETHYLMIARRPLSREGV